MKRQIYRIVLNCLRRQKSIIFQGLSRVLQEEHFFYFQLFYDAQMCKTFEVYYLFSPEDGNSIETPAFQETYCHHLQG